MEKNEAKHSEKTDTENKFERVVSERQNLLYEDFFSLTNNQRKAEDLTFQTFQRVAQNWELFEDRSIREISRITAVIGQIIGWRHNRIITAVASKRCRNRIKRSYRQNAEDVKDSMLLALSLLSPPYYEIIALKHYFHFNAKEIASLLHIPVLMVKFRIKIGERRVQKTLNAHQKYVENMAKK